MSKVITEANTELGKRSIEVDYDFGSTLEEAIDLFGEAVVFANFQRQATVGLQAFIRGRASAVKDGAFVNSDDQILSAVAEWKPSDGTVRRMSKEDKLEKLLAGMDPDERMEFLSQFLDSGE